MREDCWKFSRPWHFFLHCFFSKNALKIQWLLSHFFIRSSWWNRTSSANLDLDQQDHMDLLWLASFAASSKVSGKGCPKLSGKKTETMAANRVPRPKTINGSCLKVTSGRYKVKYGARMDTNRLDIELKKGSENWITNQIKALTHTLWKMR